MIVVRSFQSKDAERVSEIVRRCLREVNSRDYQAHIIEKMCAYFTPERFVELSNSRRIYVAEDSGIVGTVSRDGNKVYTMFVDPAVHGRRIGRQLMEHIETLAAGEGYEEMETGASITAYQFYLKLGYAHVRETDTEFGLNYILRKPLLPAEKPAGR
jgi:GNAT superfamily N-acetyltransferase